MLFGSFQLRIANLFKAWDLKKIYTVNGICVSSETCYQCDPIKNTRYLILIQVFERFDETAPIQYILCFR